MAMSSVSGGARPRVERLVRVGESLYTDKSLP